MSPLRFPLLLTLIVAGLSPALAQQPIECSAAECAPTAASPASSHAQLWAEASATYRLKLEFVEAIQRFTRAQAGTFGDEGTDLMLAVTTMRGALSRWDAAIRQFEARAARETEDAERHVAVATVMLNRHRIGDTLRELSAAERLDGNRVDVYTLRALAFGVAGRAEDTARALRRASSLNPDNPATYYSLAQQLMLLKRSDDAADALRGFQRALQRRRVTAKDADARVSPFERVDLLRQAADTAPIFPQARYAAGFTALESGDYEVALTRFAESVTTDPIVGGTQERRDRLALAAASLREGRIDVASQQLESAVQASPEDAELHRLLGLTYWIDEQPGKSLEQLRAAIRLAPGDERARATLSDVLVGERRFAEAERELTQAGDTGNQSGPLRYRRAQLYQRQSLLQSAAAAFAESASMGPFVGRDRFYLEWGSLLVNQADFDGAIAAYARRVRVNPNSAEAHRQLGEIYFLQGRHDEALAEFSVAIWLDPKDARAHAAAGQVQFRMRRYAEAITPLQRALSLDATLREARYALGTALVRTGKTDEGTRELGVFERQQAEAEASGQREFQLDALRRQASKDLLSKDVERAVSQFTEAANLDPRSARSHRDLGLALLRAKRASEAVTELESAQRIEATAEGFLYLADAYATLGNTEEAVRQRTLQRAFVQKMKVERVRELSGR